MTNTVITHTRPFLAERTVVAAACVAANAADGPLPGAEASELPMVPGFVKSTFNPLVRETIRSCLGPPEDNVLAGDGARTAIVLATVAGDATTSDLASRNLVGGRVHNPMLFFQSVTTSIVGFITIEYDITGPVSCVGVDRDCGAEALHVADLLLTEDAVRQVVVVAADLAASPRTRLVYDRLAETGVDTAPPSADLAVAMLLRDSADADSGLRLTAPPGRPASPRPALGHLDSLVDLTERFRREPRP